VCQTVVTGKNIGQDWGCHKEKEEEEEEGQPWQTFHPKRCQFFNVKRLTGVPLHSVPGRRLPSHFDIIKGH